ncbi:MAG TPA: type II secretion system protein [Gemmataceae bacterium]|jgi:prepilin-type N-terminal cleavage/methylation domain-containing protein|nr:type II secretion system protein [Gemmataceae bacterium]
MARIPARARRGFTLVELIVVIMIMVVLAMLVAIVAPRLREDHKVTRGAEQLQGWLFIAKQEAYRDKLPRGVRLVIDPNSPQGSLWVRECLYIEQPEEYRGGVIQVPSPYAAIIQPNPAAAPNNNPPQNATAFITRGTPGGTPLDLANTGTILAGDFLTFDVAPYTTHRIYQATFVPPQGNTPGGTHLIFAAANYYPQYPNGPTYHAVPAQGAAGAQIQAEPSFHITRQAQPRAGESSLKLPKDIIVDLVEQGTSLSQAPGLTGNVQISSAGDNALDIIFNPRGGVMGLNAAGGIGQNGPVGSTVMLWVRDSAKTFPQGEHILVAVYTRTGFIAAHPVDISAPPASWYNFVRDGKNSGM